MTENTWSDWLRAQLTERAWKQADLVRESEGHIKADRVSKWLAGKESPSHKLATVTANALGVSRDEALIAAGFPVGTGELTDRDANLQAALDRISTLSPRFRLEKMLEPFADSEVLHVLRMRALKREAQDGDSGDDESINVGGSDDTNEPAQQSDFTLAAKKRSKNRGEVTYD
ncbi:hypothetical protein [Leucobacter japonicus]|uniref:hypothetical protein n=1 Tax=Leucobacter japonicus TaxID=1461259 RepID=UPI0012E25246|nr:hypothetical protein [Leucobacter japonicus]